jgi:hypothetical protein
MFLKATGRRAMPIFRKGVMASSALSKGLGTASRGLATGARVGVELGNTILSIPFAREALSMSPQGQELLSRLNMGAGLAREGAQFLGRASDLTNPLTYRPIIRPSGSIDTKALGKNIREGLERAKALDKSSEPLMKFVK